MKRPNRRWVWTSAACLTAVAAFGGCRSHRARRGAHELPSEKEVQRALKRMDATDEQEALVQEVFARWEVEARARDARRRELRAAFLEEALAAEPDAERLHGLVDRELESFGALAHRFVDDSLSLAGTLTGEQRECLAGRVDEGFGRRGR